MVWLLSLLAFADLLLMAENREDRGIMVEYFYRVCLKRESRVNVTKSKVGI